SLLPALSRMLALALGGRRRPRRLAAAASLDEPPPPSEGTGQGSPPSCVCSSNLTRAIDGGVPGAFGQARRCRPHTAIDVRERGQCAMAAPPSPGSARRNQRRRFTSGEPSPHP